MCYDDDCSDGYTDYFGPGTVLSWSGFLAMTGRGGEAELGELLVSLRSPLKKASSSHLAGIVAVEVTGGPTIEFVPGRRDSSARPKEGRLPDAKKCSQHPRDVFYRMGLTDKDIVALSGGHTLGKAHPERSGFEGAWTDNPLKFDNSYFVWSLIAARLPGRTDNEIKNYWNTHIRRKLLSRGLDPAKHRPLATAVEEAGRRAREPSRPDLNLELCISPPSQEEQKKPAELGENMLGEKEGKCGGEFLRLGGGGLLDCRSLEGS
ncbi:hypothetical protein HPP92_012719 [Vanilla planifolia]|uniref:L-ascorbate peroxidase n=1 Tax=Vanilla planifolia TaxID=51239 RepID=A0A835QWQ1_VANPL|nr:hypothetical protein HPP92_012719 [Vanilla planifolia]